MPQEIAEPALETAPDVAPVEVISAAAPPEIPIRMPSSLAERSAVCAASSVFTRITSSTALLL